MTSELIGEVCPEWISLKVQQWAWVPASYLQRLTLLEVTEAKRVQCACPNRWKTFVLEVFSQGVGGSAREGNSQNPLRTGTAFN